MLGIINGDYYCPKIKDVKEPPITFKSITGTDIYFELLKEEKIKLFFSEPCLPENKYML